MQQLDLLAVPPPPPRRLAPEPFATRHERRAAFDAWVAEGRHWPPPAGLVSACLAQLVRASRERRW